MAGSLKRGLSPGRELERELVLAFQAGDAAAYESIDRSCRPAAERICRRLLVNPADVEEAVQETMVRAYQGLPRFNGSYALKAWVARIATNVCLDTLRARSRRPVNGGTLEPNMDAPNGHDGNGHHDDPEELLEQAADAEEVRKVLSALPERHRTALVLREFEGLSHRKIAEMLDTSPERVKALIHRAKAGFRRAWKDDSGGRLAAFAPLLIPINWVRRLLGRAPEFDHPVSASTASAAQVASTPVMQSVINVATERMSTAMAAVMVAGTVGFAVHNAQEPSRAEEPPVVVEIVQAPVEPAEAKGEVVKEAKKREPKSEEPAPEAVVEASPTPELAGDLAEEPAKPDPPQPLVSPSPKPPPHPEGFAYGFTSDRTATSHCGCGGSPILVEDQVSASESGLSSFSQEIGEAAIHDATGQGAWAVELRQSGNASTHSLYFEVTSVDGTSIYEARGDVLAAQATAWGGWTYTYHGTFQRTAWPKEDADVPRRGQYDATLTFSWAQQRIVSADFSLAEAA